MLPMQRISKSGPTHPPAREPVQALSPKKIGGEAGFKFVDRRPQAIAQRQLQEMATNSPQVRQLMAVQEIIDNSPNAKRAARFQASTLRNTGSQPIQRTIDEDLQALEDVYQETRDPLLFRILQEVRLLGDVEFTSVADPEQGHAERQERGRTRAHLINLDPIITDPETRQSLILHELIHVSADRKYNVNQTGEVEPAITAVVDPHAPEPARIQDIGRQAEYRGELATHLASVVDGDWVLEDKARDLVLNRVPRIQGSSHREFDSVITELHYRLKKMHVDERTDTFREVEAMTAAAYRSRNEGLPLEQCYKEPVKTGFLG
jgi:hypothetical protein